MIAHLIETHCDQGIELASEFQKKPEYPEVRLGTEQMRRVRAETAVVFLRIVDEVAFGVLDAENRDWLMEELRAFLADMLDSRGVPASEFRELLCVRYSEYAPLRISADGFERGGLLREYADKIGAIVNIERNALFHTTLTWLLFRSLERWDLKDLLTG